MSDVAGFALLASAAVYLALGLLVIQPRMLAGAGPTADAAGMFLQRAIATRDIHQIAAELATAVRDGAGAHRSLLIVPTPEGARAVGDSGALNQALDEATEAFVWLSERAEPVTRGELAQLSEFPGAAAAARLLAALQCEVALPLRHRGVLLGLAAVGGAQRTPAEVASFYTALRAFTTAAVANTYLDAEARAGQSLTQTFDLAGAMQEALMPDERAVRRPTFELRGAFRPVEACGGDLWVWRELGQGRLLFLIGDATGHGAAPAMLAAVAKGAIDAHWQLAGPDLDPAALLRTLNRSVHRAGRTRYMMTAFAAVLDKQAQTLRFANAGQNFPYFLRADGGLEALVARGNTLGATAEVRFETHTRPMRMGDRVLLYTDGIIDAGAPAREPFGERRLRAALQGLAHERATRIPQLLLAEVDEFVGATELSDDITLACAEFGPTTGASGAGAGDEL